MRSRQRWALLAVACCVWCAGGCADEATGVPKLEDLNVLLIVIDTFGAEHAGGFMNPGLGHTPHMDRLAERGVVFRRAYAPSPWTQPSVASLLTAVMPARHGLRTFTQTIDPDLPTLAERLGARGFATGAVISNMAIEPKYGFARGFDSYATGPASGGHDSVTSTAVTDRAISWIDEQAGGRFFFMAHYFDPHYLYVHHPEFDQTSDYRGPIRSSMSIWTIRDLRRQLTPADIDHLIGLHREEIAHTDAQIGRLLAHLRSSGLDENTLVILTADHGEEFMRHGWVGHTVSLYEELLHVPMIVSLPGAFPPSTVDAPVSLIDVMPTLLSLSREPEPERDGTGLSLLPYLKGVDDPARERSLYGEVSYVPLKTTTRTREKIAFKTSLLSGRLKLIHDLPTDAWELYDLDRDPTELDDRMPAGHPAAGRLRAELEAWEAARGPESGEPSPGPVQLDAEEIERLRDLGYIK